MSQTKLPSRLPPRVVKEIEDNPDRLDYWLRWSAVGDARDALQEAKQRMWFKSAEWIECVKKAGNDYPSDPCECGQCQTEYLRLREARDQAERAVDDAIVTLKERA